jgi:hypothetical protein
MVARHTPLPLLDALLRWRERYVDWCQHLKNFNLVVLDFGLFYIELSDLLLTVTLETLCYLVLLTEVLYTTIAQWITKRCPWCLDIPKEGLLSTDHVFFLQKATFSSTVYAQLRSPDMHSIGYLIVTNSLASIFIPDFQTCSFPNFSSCICPV